MGSELSFLIELLLNHALPKATKDLIAARIKEVEHNMTSYKVTTNIPVMTTGQLQVLPGQLQQAASTLAAMARHGDIAAPVVVVPPPAPEPVVNIAQTPQTAQALMRRQEAISDAISGKVDKTSGKARKW